MDNCGNSSVFCWYLLQLSKDRGIALMKLSTALRVTHTFKALSHRFLGYYTPSDLRFYSLSTGSRPSYYYYLYIQETLPQTNHTPFSHLSPGLILNSKYVDAFPRKDLYKNEKMRMRAAA